MMTIENTQECFVRLWLRLERTRRLLQGQHRRFCIRRVLKVWLGPEATDDFIWEVCRLMTNALANDEGYEPVCGWDELPPPSLYPRRHRELLRALVRVKLCLTSRQVSVQAIDTAYSLAFPQSTPININKKKRKT